MIYNGQLGDGWTLAGSLGVVLPPVALGPVANFTDLCLDLPGGGAITFLYSGPNPFVNHTSLSFASKLVAAPGAPNGTAPQQLDITLTNSKFPVVSHR